MYREKDEQSLFKRLVDIVKKTDPDILVGYEIQNSSWGYVIQRCKHLDPGSKIMSDISRVDSNATTKFGKNEDSYGDAKHCSIFTTGRICMNLWRIMKDQLNLVSYSLENVAYHLLHIRVPHYKFELLTSWYTKGPLKQWKTIQHLINRVQYTIKILDYTNYVNQTCEFSRIYGCDFYSTMTRGNQFKVEMVMTRISRPESYLAISPSREAVATMRALECAPLVMEPESAFYNNPLAVLDFQSLYPSIIIANNYCFTTCLGRLDTLGTINMFGVVDNYLISMETVAKYKDDLIGILL